MLAPNALQGELATAILIYTMNLCPVEAMLRLLRVDTHRHTLSPIFCIGRHKQLSFKREYVVAKLQKLARHAGLGYGLWNEYSFRRGAATWAAEVGISEAEIQTLGRWRLDAYKAYIEYSLEEQVCLSRRFQAAQNVHTSATPPA